MVGEFAVKSQPVYGALIGKPKSADLSSMDELQMLLKDIVPGLKSVSDTYNHYKIFGGDDYCTPRRLGMSPHPYLTIVALAVRPDPHPHPTSP